MVFENVGKTTEVYPCIGMRQTNESVRANFGGAPFRFAIEEHVRAQRDAVWGNIMNTRIDWSLLGLGPRKSEEERRAEDARLAAEREKGGIEDEEESRAPLRKLVLAYLAHHGYARTARAFQKQCAERAAALASKPSVQPKTESYEDDDDVKMAIDDGVPAVASNPVPGPSSAAYDADADGDFGFDHELNTRLSITNAIVRGDVDSALALLGAHHATVLEREQGLVLFRLRCRKFVELVLAAGDALRRVKEAERAAPVPASSPPPPAPKSPVLDGEDVVGTMDGVGAMDVDDPSPEARPASSTPTSVSAPVLSAPLTTTVPLAPSPAPTPLQNTHAALAAAARASLHDALSYGQTLEADYKGDARPGVRAHLRRTFGVVAYDDPIAAGGEVAEIAGQAARNALAAEVNQAILGEYECAAYCKLFCVLNRSWIGAESQGRPAHPALETLFRQAGACVTQLGLLGVGSAAFADVRKEFLEG